jgi:hypothetical protein
MATDMGSLAAGLDGHVVRIGRMGFRKTCLFFRCTHHSIVDSIAFALLKSTTSSPNPLCLLRLTLFAPPTNSPLLHSLALYTRLVILGWSCICLCSLPFEEVTPPLSHSVNNKAKPN